MNKLLTTITLLFFSVAANADIYFCESTADGDILKPNVMGTRGNYIDHDGGSKFIVDSEQGVRNGSGMTEIEGPCKIVESKFLVEPDLLVCTGLFGDTGINSFAIDTEDNTFTYVEQNYRARISFYIGTCTEG
jgi:hypothetical protein